MRFSYLWSRCNAAGDKHQGGGDLRGKVDARYEFTRPANLSPRDDTGTLRDV